MSNSTQSSQPRMQNPNPCARQKFGRWFKCLAVGIHSGVALAILRIDHRRIMIFPAILLMGIDLG